MIHKVRLLKVDAQHLAGDLIQQDVVYMASYDDHLVILQSLDPKLLEIAKQYPIQEV